MNDGVETEIAIKYLLWLDLKLIRLQSKLTEIYWYLGPGITLTLLPNRNARCFSQ